MFNWIRNRVRDAILAGVQDAVDTIANPPADGQLDLPEPRLLRLPAGDDQQDAAPAKRVRK